MFLTPVSSKLYLFCMVEINQFTVEETAGYNYICSLAFSLSLPQQKAFGIKISMLTQFSNLTVVHTVSQKGLMPAGGCEGV